MLLGLTSAVPTSADWWPIALPLLAGGTAIYLLLPRPRAYPLLWGTGLGILALVLAGVLLTRSGTFSPETILFWSFSALAIVAGALLVTQHNPARAALAFALVVLSVCGLFLLLAAPFLMAATIIIYAGAIIVTFLFVIMLAAQSGLSDADDRSREPLLTTLTGFILLGTLLFVLQRYDHTQEIDRLLSRTREAAKLDSRADMEEKVGKPGDDEELFNQFNKLFGPWKDLHHESEQVSIAWSNIDRNDSRAVEKSRAQLKELIELGEHARHRLGWLPVAADLPFSNMSGPPPSVGTEQIRRDEQGLPRMPADNAAYLGRSLFSDFLLPVELGGTLLLVATVGAIAIAFRRS
ncbi:MAG TPA: NADH-quinone oxidoreductase subunit J [Gemmataceae bacterium]|nr:NADH-quinone oxidoreductase subunit J [Gemmataceae bacterium]